MRNGKAEVLDTKLDGTNLRVTLASREDRDLYIKTMRGLSRTGTIFETPSDTVVVCKLPPPTRV